MAELSAAKRQAAEMSSCTTRSQLHHAMAAAGPDSVNASRGISPRRPMRGPNVVLLPTMKV
jgi:hypothetical protein